jgi:hypothetical protein
MDEVFAMADRVAGTRIVRHDGIACPGPRRTRGRHDERQGEDCARDAPPDQPSAHRDRLSEAEGHGASATHPHAFPSALYRSAPDLKIA